MMTWQQIESAPTEGEHVLITDGETIFTAFLLSQPTVWLDAWSGTRMTAAFTPTHWMPLPEPPK